MLPDDWRQRYQDFFRQPREGWSHAQLVEVAVVALRQDGEQAPGRLRQQLEKIGPGYHETVTGCWLELVRQAGQQDWSAPEISRRLSFSQLPFAFYSPQRLRSQEAAQTFLAPDLKPVSLPGQLPADLADTLVAFQSRQLGKEDWTHRCHLRVAAAIFLLLGEPGGYVMATGIQRLNETHGVPMTPSGGYHETLTRLWFRLVARAVVASALHLQPLSEARWEQMLRSLDDKKLPLRYYSRDRIMSWEARTSWLEPDLASLDAVDFV